MFAFQGVLYEVIDDRIVLHPMPLLLAALCILAIAHRYYSAFFAARLAGLGFVVVKALGGEEAALPTGTVITLPQDKTLDTSTAPLYTFPPGCEVRYNPTDKPSLRSESFQVRLTAGTLSAVNNSVTLP